MNIMLNSYCNLKCPYCFADNEINLSEEKTISEENFEKYLSFLQNNNIKQIRIIGGEPTIHPYFGFLLNKIVEKNFFEHIHIFSNMSFSKEIRDLIILLSEKIIITMLPNFNNKNITNKKFELIRENIKILSKYNISDTIGINLYSPDMSLDYFFDLITEIKNEYNKNIEVRWAIVVPNNTLDEDFDFKKYFHDFYDLLITFFTRLNKLNIKNRIDCNSIPFCAFSEKEIYNLIKLKPDIFAKQTKCEPVIDTNPKLETFRCFGLSEDYKIKLHENMSINYLIDDIKEHTKELEEKTVLDECYECDFYKINRSSCSCMAYRKDKK